MKKIKQWVYFTWLFILGKVSSETLQNVINESKDATEKKEPATKWQSDKLEYVDSITTEPQQNLNFFEFFQDRKGLWVWGSFTGNVLKYVTGIVDKMEAITAYYFELKENLSDSEISQELPKGYEFGLIGGLALIVWLILKQWGGKDGALLNTDYRANIFPLKIGKEVLVIGVDWDAGGGAWRVSAWKFGEDVLWVADPLSVLLQKSGVTLRILCLTLGLLGSLYLC